MDEGPVAVPVGAAAVVAVTVVVFGDRGGAARQDDQGGREGRQFYVVRTAADHLDPAYHQVTGRVLGPRMRAPDCHSICSGGTASASLG